MPKKSTSIDTELVTLRLPSALLKRIDRWSKKAGRMSRSDAMRTLMDVGLKAEEDGPPLPGWIGDLEALAARLNTDAEGAIAVLREYVETPEPEPSKPPRKGLRLASWFA